MHFNRKSLSRGRSPRRVRALKMRGNWSREMSIVIASVATKVFMSGDRDTPDRDYVCQSDPRDECIMPASGPDNQVFADRHFYYHGAGAETKYAGSIEIGVFQGSPQTHRSQVNLTVKKSESITNQSVVGIVTNSPGSYAVKFDL